MERLKAHMHGLSTTIGWGSNEGVAAYAHSQRRAHSRVGGAFPHLIIPYNLPRPRIPYNHQALTIISATIASVG